MSTNSVRSCYPFSSSGAPYIPTHSIPYELQDPIYNNLSSKTSNSGEVPSVSTHSYSDQSFAASLTTESALQAAVYDSLEFYLYPNAIFLAERLHTSYPTDVNLLLLATCYTRAWDYGSAYRLLEYYRVPLLRGTGSSDGKDSSSQSLTNTSVSSPQWKLCYLYSVCCYHLGKYGECVDVILRNLALMSPTQHSNSTGGDVQTSCSLMASAAQQHLLGMSASKAGIKPSVVSAGNVGELLSSKQSLEKAVQLNPSLFTAFEGCIRWYYQPQSDSAQYVDGSSLCRPLPSILDVYTSGSNVEADKARSTQGEDVVGGNETKRKQSDKKQPLGAQIPNPKINPSASYRDGPSGLMGSILTPIASCASTDIVRKFLAPFAEVTALLLTYNCADAKNVAIQMKGIRSSGDVAVGAVSGWSYGVAALAMCHSQEYSESAAYFKKMLRAQPWRLNDPSLIQYSTVLWHLKDEATLIRLSQETLCHLKDHPISLCISGNYYSLKRDTRSALIALTRATELEPTLAVAHILRGSEIGPQDKEEAEKSFLTGLQYEPRDYTALASLGRHYLNDEKINIAKNRLEQAIKINPLPSIINLFAHTFFAGKKGWHPASLEKALKAYDQALALYPRNVRCRLEKASILKTLHQFELALQEAAILQDLFKGKDITHWVQRSHTAGCQQYEGPLSQYPSNTAYRNTLAGSQTRQAYKPSVVSPHPVDEARLASIIGECREGLGDLNGAMVSYQMAVELTPNNDEKDRYKPLLEKLSKRLKQTQGE